MSLERIDYIIEGFSAMELYPFTHKTKRYFKAVHENFPNQSFRIIGYVIDLVEKQSLLEHLRRIKQIGSPSLGRIMKIVESVKLIRLNEHLQKYFASKPSQQIIAVIFEQKQIKNFVYYYDFVVEIGPLSQVIVKEFTNKLLELIRAMNAQHISNGFYPDDVFIEKRTGQIRIDCYGDRKYFKLKEEYISDLWELGFFTFTCLKTIPPYTKKSSSDPHYNCLSKGNHPKFWAQINKKTTALQQNLINFIDSLLSITNAMPLAEVSEHPWLKEYQGITNEQKIGYIKQIGQDKLDKLAKMQVQKRQRKQKILKAVIERNSVNKNIRSKLNDVFLQNFMEKLDEQESNERAFDLKKQKVHIKIEDTFLKVSNIDPNIAIAYILTLLGENIDENVQISNIKDNKENNSISFKIDAEVDDIFEVKSEVDIKFVKDENSVGLWLDKVKGSLFESLWIKNYLCEMLAQV